MTDFHWLLPSSQHNYKMKHRFIPSLFLLFWVRVRIRVRIRVSIRHLLIQFVDEITSPQFHRWELVLTFMFTCYVGDWNRHNSGPPCSPYLASLFAQSVTGRSHSTVPTVYIWSSLPQLHSESFIQCHKHGGCFKIIHSPLTRITSIFTASNCY